jgi:glutamate synthase (NADPH) small chain
MELGAPDASGRRSPVATGKTETIPVDLVIMALGNDSNPIIKDSEPRLKTSKWGTLVVEHGAETTLEDVYSGGDATRGGSTAINAAGDGKAAAEEIAKEIPFTADEIKERVARAAAYTAKAQTPYTIVKRADIAAGIVEITVKAPMVAKSARAGQFVRVLPTPKGELIPLTLADWDAKAGTIDLVIQGLGASSMLINQMKPGEALTGIAGPLGQPSKVHKYAADETVVFCAGGVGLPPVYPIAREHLRLGNHVTLIAGYRTKSALFWTAEGERVDKLKKKFGDQLDVIYCTNDGTFGLKGFVTTPLQEMIDAGKVSKGRKVAEVIAIGPPLMMKAVSGADEEGRPDADGGQPELDHGGRHRHVRRLHGAGARSTASWCASTPASTGRSSTRTSSTGTSTCRASISSRRRSARASSATAWLERLSSASATKPSAAPSRLRR